MKKAWFVLALSFSIFTSCKKTENEVVREDEKDISANVVGIYLNPVNAPVPENEYDYRETKWVILRESNELVSVNEKITTVWRENNVQMIDTVKTSFQHVRVSPDEDNKFALSFDSATIVASDSIVKSGKAIISGNLLESSIIFIHQAEQLPVHQVRIFKQEDNN